MTNLNGDVYVYTPDKSVDYATYLRGADDYIIKQISV